MAGRTRNTSKGEVEYPLGMLREPPMASKKKKQPPPILPLHNQDGNYNAGNDNGGNGTPSNNTGSSVLRNPDFSTPQRFSRQLSLASEDNIGPWKSQ
ncbi:hypothetical protein ABW20_dc0106458 [Dactylellina cionopaga]|nr:hypothetical protein ABW20_dc0106458 [Dactylellina cionopaga]